MLQFHAVASRHAGGFSRDWAANALAPGPRISKPELGQDVQCGRFRAALYGRNSNEHVLDASLGALDKKIEIEALRKNARIAQFEFVLTTHAEPVLFVHGV